MRILHVITSLRIGGAEKLMVDLLPRMRECGHTVELCVFDGIRTPFYTDLVNAGIPIHSFGVGHSVYDPLHIIRLWKLMNGFDIVHTHNTAPQMFAAIAHLFSKNKLVTTEHNTSNRRRGNCFWKVIDKWMYGCYDYIICISNKAEENLCEWIGIVPCSINTIPNGINIDRITNAKSSMSYLPGCKNAIHTTLMVAAFRWEKDQKTLIRAYKELPTDYHTVFAGGGDESIKEECIELTRKLGIADRVHFLGLREDIPVLLKAADAIVLSSHFEGLSLSSLEGMASGKPFIASDVDGLREIVSGFGVLFPHEDAHALANAILKVSKDNNYVASVVEKCVSRAMQFDISVMVSRYIDAYNSLLLQ